MRRVGGSEGEGRRSRKLLYDLSYGINSTKHHCEFVPCEKLLNLLMLTSPSLHCGVLSME